ncbi:hypothetical protein ED733_003440 [Metarhizium rileyi]|uniref:Uncharacterized protein n=1 Tax=Metarhizium rileyi (strain RCEF 4871) TaxID=1649241 RepID=A0A5C6GD44_METRR|nr:hypothetical protein ED733_003440 [Metarhizium rileyi]
MGNLLDAELQSRAGMLHDNAAALDRQESRVVEATEGLRRETDKLRREADGAARGVKELGNVQNWAEVLERGFLVLEETVSLGRRGKGIVVEDVDEDVDVDVDGGSRSAWSDASRSLMEHESSMGSGRAKGSETASLSTGSLRDGGDGGVLGS